MSDMPVVTAAFSPSRNVILSRILALRYWHRLYKIDEVEAYYRCNPYILSGYRGSLNYFECFLSIFSIHNETVNIWSHLVGFVFFAVLFIYDFYSHLFVVTSTIHDILILLIIMLSYQTCMIMSSFFHTFTCHSKQISENCFSLDLLGITFALLATFFSGIYYAFWCEPGLRDFYLVTVGSIFILAICMQLWPKFTVDEYAWVRLNFFAFWAIFGILPMFHWLYIYSQDEIVTVMFPRMLIMYAISGSAFLIYVCKLPERFFPGQLDIIGHSHQWWHAFIFVAFLFWRNTGIIFALIRTQHGCTSGVPAEDLKHFRLWPF